MIGRAIIAGFAAMLCAGSATARQATDDWTLTDDESRRLVLATATYSSGQTIAVRCSEGDLETLISGVPPVAGASRRVEATYADGRVDAGLWINSEDGSLIFSPVPHMDARRLRRGGPIQLAVAILADPDSPLRRYALDLPAQSANLDRVLKACNAEGPDPRDELIRWVHPSGGANLWRRQPMPHYPPAAVSLGAGFAVLSCIAAEAGRLTDCRAERESHHRRYGFGEAALRSLRDARLAPPEQGGPQPGQLVVSTVRFRIDSAR